MKKLVLSSSSPARKILLERLGLPFQVVNPNIDENQLAGESPQQLVERLAIEKAKVHQNLFPNALIIGSDQVAVMDGDIVGKPRTHEKAVAILKRASGQDIVFYTGLALYNTDTHKVQVIVESYRVLYRVLTRDMIENYLLKEKPYECAGSIKVEGLGIALMKELIGTDPSTLTGLPLIALVNMLEQEGIHVI